MVGGQGYREDWAWVTGWAKKVIFVRNHIRGQLGFSKGPQSLFFIRNHTRKH